MKNIIKTFVLTMALVLVIAAFASCEFPTPELPEAPCTHEGTEEILSGKAATCTEAGLTEGKKCSVCGTVIVAQEEIAALGHKEETLPAKAATCTATGLTEGKKCSVCGTVTVAQEEIAALGHKEETLPAKAATCTATGLTEGKKCSVCGTVTVAQTTIPAGHTWGEVDANGNVPCTKCDVVVVSTSAGLTSAVQAGATNIVLADGEYDVDGCGGKTLTISGTHNAVINVVGSGAGEGNGQIDYGFDGSVVTFNGVTIKTNGQTYAGYARMSATYNGCVIENTYCLYQSSTFNACTFNVSGDAYNLWTWGPEKVDINGCTFNSDGKALLLYGTANTKLTVSATTFNDKGGLDSLKAAIEIGNDYNRSYELIVNNVTVNGYAINDKGINTGSTLWGNKNSMTQDNLNVVVDGVDVY